MTFALSGTVITQSGTDTDLSGIASIAGVTTISAGDHTIYNLETLYLNITGTLTIDPEVEELFFGAGDGDGRVTVENGGTLNIGQEIDTGTGTRYSSGTWARFTADNSGNFQETESDLKVENGGTIEWYGGTMYSKRVVAFMEGSTVRTHSRECQIIGQHDAEFQIRQRSTNTEVNGLITRGYFVTLIASPTSWSGWQPFDTQAQALAPSFTTPDNTFIVLADADFAGIADQQVAYWSNVWIRLVNCEQGSSVDAQGNSDDHANNRGIFEIRQEVTLTARSFSGGSVDGAKVYCIDTDNGNRLAANTIGTNPDYTPSRTYELTFDSNGEEDIDTDGGVLVAVLYRETGGARAINNEIDRRSRSNDASDDFRFISMSYLYDPAILDLTLSGVGGTDGEFVLFDDEVITETTKATVDAYTELDTAAKFYDHAKAYLVDNFEGETSVLVTREGSIVDAGDRNITIDATATNVFSLDGSGDITIKASAYTGGLKTTGTVTLSNGATVDGSIQSSAGIRVQFNGLPTGTGRAIIVCEELDSNGDPLATPVFVNATADESTGQATALLNADTIYRYIADALGYYRGEPIQFNTGQVTSVVVSLSQIQDALGSAIYGNGDDDVKAQITYDSASDEYRHRVVFSDSGETTQAAINDTDAQYVFTVTDNDAIVLGDVIKIDDEIMLVTASNASSRTATRGHFETTLASHTSGTAIFVLGNTDIDFSSAIDKYEELSTTHANIQSDIDQPIYDTGLVVFPGGEGTTLVLADHPDNEAPVNLEYTVRKAGETTSNSMRRVPFHTVHGLNMPDTVNVITVDPMAPTVGQIADAVWDEARADHSASGSFGEAAQDAAPTAQQIWEYDISGITTENQAGKELQDATASGGGGGGASASDIADAVWNEARADHVTAGSFGQALQNPTLSAADVNAEVDTALSDYDGPTKAELDTGLAGLNDLSAAQVNAQVDTALADYDGPTNAELTAALAALNNLSATEVNAQVDIALADYDGPTKAELDTAQSAITTAIGNLNDLSSADVTAAVPTTAEIEAALIDEGDGQQLIDAIVGVINSNLDIPLAELTLIAQAVRTELATELARIDASVSSRSTLSAADVNAEVDTALADYDAPTKAELDTAIAGLNDLSAADVNAQVDIALSDYDGPTKAELDTAIAGLNDLSAADVNAEVDAALADYDAPTKAELDTAVSSIRDDLDQLISYHTGPSVYMDSNGTAMAVQADAYFVVLFDSGTDTASFFDSDGRVVYANVNRYIAALNADGASSSLGDATQLVEYSETEYRSATGDS